MSNNSILYHGGTTIVKEPLTHVGRSDLDFGPGFYVTNDRQQAVDWATTKASRKKGLKAVLNIYKFDIDGFSAELQYKQKRFTKYDTEWLDFIAFSRKGKQPWNGLDWIEGGIANDSVISTVDAYVDGMITAEQAMGQLINAKLKHQICICSQDIIDKYLVFVESVEL